MWQLLAKPLLGVVADGVKGFVETRKLKGEVKIAQIQAEKKKNEDIAAGKIKWEASAVEQMKGSWKDEFVLLCFASRLPLPSSLHLLLNLLPICNCVSCIGWGGEFDANCVFRVFIRV